MANDKFAAQTENRTFYFYIVQRSDNDIHIKMYGTPYIFIKNGDRWENHNSNYFSMARLRI